MSGENDPYSLGAFLEGHCQLLAAAHPIDGQLQLQYLVKSNQNLTEGLPGSF